MAPELAGVMVGTRNELEDLLHQIRQHGLRYARDYGNALLGGWSPPRRPRQLPRGVCVAIESIVEEQCQLTPRCFVR